MNDRSGSQSIGFTLIELVVVISIITLLVGILLPAVVKVKQTAIKTVCSSNLRQIGIAIMTYQDGNQQKFPQARYMPAPFISSFQADLPLFMILADEFPDDSKVYRCGGDNGYVYDLTGISYTYNGSLSGRQLDETWFARRLKFNVTEIPVAYDCDGNTFQLEEDGQITVPAFHVYRNLLFADGHVGNYH